MVRNAQAVQFVRKCDWRNRPDENVLNDLNELDFVPRRLQHLMHGLDINDQGRQLQFFVAQ